MKTGKKYIGNIGVDIINYIALPIIILIVWYLIKENGQISDIVLPSPADIWLNFLEQLKSGQLQKDTYSSVLCVFKGYAIGALLGIGFGIVSGVFIKVQKFFTLIFDGVRQIPGIAWFPLIILWFGIGDLSKIILVANGTFFPVLINTIEGVRNTDKSYLDLVKLYRVNAIDVLFKIYLPSALPFVFTGLKLGASRAWMSVVAAEMLGASSGLGYRISNSQQLMQSDVLIVDIIVIGILGWVFNLIIEKITKFSTKWKNI